MSAPIQTPTLRTWHIIAVIAAVFIVLGWGITLGWILYHPKAAPMETPASAVRQGDGSLVLERAAQNPDAKPAQEIPNGSKPERIVSVKVQPRRFKAPVVKENLTTDATGKQQLDVQPPPVNVDLSLVRMPDQTRRVVASSPDGEVIGGLDIPAEPVPQPDDKKWAAGLSYNPQDKSAGVWVDRDMGPFRMGVEISQRKQEFTGKIGYEARLKLGIRF